MPTRVSVRLRHVLAPVPRAPHLLLVCPACGATMDFSLAFRRASCDLCRLRLDLEPPDAQHLFDLVRCYGEEAPSDALARLVVEGRVKPWWATKPKRGEGAA
jgi:hypothetical protein